MFWCSGRIWLAGYLAVAAINLIAAALVADRVGFVTVLVAMPLLFCWYVSHRPPLNRLLLVSGVLRTADPAGRPPRVG